MVLPACTSFDWLSVQKNVGFGMRISGLPAAQRRERAARFIDLAGPRAFAHADPSQLSGGMRQRVAIARTLANDPEMLLMDEPFGALDAKTRRPMQELMIGVAWRTGATMVVVTHDPEEAIVLAGKIVFLSAHPGRLKQEIVPEFKHGRRIGDREQVVRMDGYGAHHAHLMHMMREEGRHTEAKDRAR